MPLSNSLQQTANKEKLMRCLAWGIIAAGTALRFYVYFQNRNLMIDELNVVRNIYERNWAGLLRPLEYHQFAPPLFLWMLKSISTIGGFSEKAMRLYPLLCSVAALVLLYKILVRLGLRNYALPALCMFAFSAFIVRYSTDVKQYLPDAMTVLALIYIALVTPLRARSAFKFGLIWTVAGSTAILLSMPSIFMLLAVGLYYLPDAARRGTSRKLLPLVFAVVCWLVVFGVYYHFLLRHQIGSGYLQNWHQSYFLNLHFGDAEVRERTGSLLQSLLQLISGTENNSIAQILCLLLLLTGIGYTAVRARGVLVLCGVPVLAMLIASCFHAFTLLPRVCIFSVPLCLILITYGLRALAGLLAHRSWIPVAAVTIFMLVCTVPTKLLAERLEVDEIRTCVSFARAHGVAYSRIYFDEYVAESVIYYGGIHPDQATYKPYKEMKLIADNSNLDSLRMKLAADSTRCAFVCFEIDDPALFSAQRQAFSVMQPVDSIVKPSYRVFVFSAARRQFSFAVR